MEGLFLMVHVLFSVQVLSGWCGSSSGLSLSSTVQTLIRAYQTGRDSTSPALSRTRYERNLCSGGRRVSANSAVASVGLTKVSDPFAVTPAVSRQFTEVAVQLLSVFSRHLQQH